MGRCEGVSHLDWQFLLHNLMWGADIRKLYILVCVCVCVCVHVYIYIYMNIHVCMYVSMCVWMYAYVYVCMYECTYFCICVCMHICICVHICAHIYVCVCIYVCSMHVRKLCVYVCVRAFKCVHMCVRVNLSYICLCTWQLKIDFIKMQSVVWVNTQIYTVWPMRENRTHKRNEIVGILPNFLISQT